MENIVISVKVRLIAALCGLACGAVFVMVMLINDIPMWHNVPMWLAFALIIVSAISLLALFALEKKKASPEYRAKHKE